MHWTLEQLRHFVAAADAGSFSAAARQVGRAQSAVSTSLGLLEADLGVELFDRSRRNATLTRAGEVLLQEARELLRQAAGLEQRALSFAAGQDAHLSLALDEALPDRVLGALVKEVSARFPALELTQLNGTATEVADYVSQGRASVAFHYDRGDPGAAFAHRYLGDVGQGIFVARDHPLAALPEVTRNDLARHRQLVMRMEGGGCGDESVGVAFRQFLQHRRHGRGWLGLGHSTAEHRRVRGLPRGPGQCAVRRPVAAAAVGAHALAAGPDADRHRALDPGSHGATAASGGLSGPGGRATGAGRLRKATAAAARARARQAFLRYTSTGVVECASTFCVWLPSTTAAMPRRPCEAMAIRSQWRSRAVSMMAW